MLDTSGVVIVDRFGEPPMRAGYRWADLSPFAQGYVEALFARVGYSQEEPDGRITRVPLAFSDLAPEALTMILRDCEGYLARPKSYGADGRDFWTHRQLGSLEAFPPLRVYLNDAGKVMLEVAR